jgi:hypothetical protein
MYNALQEWNKKIKKDWNARVDYFFRMDLIDRSYWSGGFFSDLWVYIRGANAYVGVIASHKMSPYPKSKRLLVLLAGFLLSLGLESMYQLAQIALVLFNTVMYAISDEGIDALHAEVDPLVEAYKADNPVTR